MPMLRKVAVNSVIVLKRRRCYVGDSNRKTMVELVLPLQLQKLHAGLLSTFRRRLLPSRTTATTSSPEELALLSLRLKTEKAYQRMKVVTGSPGESDLPGAETVGCRTSADSRTERRMNNDRVT
jgi:hypothetical protein